MADETLRFDIVGEDHASDAFSRVGNAAGTMSAKMDIAALQAKVLDGAMQRQAIAARVSVDATLALARADKILAETVAKPMDAVILTDKARKALDDIRLRADKLKATFPEFTAKIDDTAYKAKLAVMAAEAKVTGDLISKELSAGPGGSVGSKLLGLIPGVGGGGGGAGGAAGAASSGGGALASLPPAGIAAAATTALAAIPVIASLATVATGAGIGLAAFAAVGANAYGKLTSDIAALHTANENFSESALNVDTALSTSAANTAIYNKALAAMPPNLASAAKLLGDQNARWQDLSLSQQNNVVALANNKTAMTSLLPSQKAALTELIAGKKAWDDMTPAQQAAAASMNKISDAWGKLTTAMEPSVMKVIAAAMDQVAKAVGPIGDLAKAAVPGITALVGVLGTGMIGFLKGVQPLIGPSLGALNTILQQVFKGINTGLVPAMVAGLPNFVKFAGAIGTATGALIEMLGALFRASSWIIANAIPAIHDLAIAFDDWRHNVAADVHQVSDIIDTLRTVTAKVGDAFQAAFKIAAGAVLQFGIIMVQGAKAITGVFLTMVGNIINGAAKAFGWVPGLGGKLRGAAADFSTWRTGVNSDFDKVIAKMQAWQNGLNAAKNTSANATQAISKNFTGVGADANTTTGKVNALNTALTRLPKNVSVSLTETGVGNFTITQGTSGHAGGTPTGGRPGAASGLYIATGTGPTADDVLIRASRGELVVPAHIVGSGLVDHLKGLIPGFASGGSIGALAGGTAAFSERFTATMTAAMEKAMTAAMTKALSAAVTAASAAVAAGGGVARWAGVVRSVLGQLGLPGGDAGTILSQMSTESGGDPTIVNKWDSNWLAGHPSVGLMQVIAGTFARYAGPYRNTGPFSYGVSTNPTANTYAGVNYAVNTYGNPGFLNVLGHGHGYDQGGYLPTGWSLAWNGTGRPEPVGAASQDGLVAELRALRAEVRQLNNTAAAIPRATGQHVGAAVNGAAGAAAVRARYPSNR